MSKDAFCTRDQKYWRMQREPWLLSSCSSIWRDHQTILSPAKITIPFKSFSKSLKPIRLAFGPKGRPGPICLKKFKIKGSPSETIKSKSKISMKIQQSNLIRRKLLLSVWWQLIQRNLNLIKVGWTTSLIKMFRKVLLLVIGLLRESSLCCRMSILEVWTLLTAITLLAHHSRLPAVVTSKMDFRSLR